MAAKSSSTPTPRLDVLFSESARQVFLLRGRAIFNVQHAPARPFVVDAGAVQVRVLGTRFVVEQLEPQVRVSVAQGRIELSSAWGSNFYGEPRNVVLTLRATY